MIFLKELLRELVAQLVEHRPFKALVLGSSPSELTTSRFPHNASPAWRARNSSLYRFVKWTGETALSFSAAVSGVMSRCGIPSISNPTMNFRTVAERSNGG